MIIVEESANVAIKFSFKVLINFDHMAKETIKLSLNEFMQFIIKPGYARKPFVAQVKEQRQKEYSPHDDYWRRFREGVKKVLKGQWTLDTFKDMKEDLPDKKVDNYSQAIDGFAWFIEKKKVSWVAPPRSTTKFNSIRLDVNPELGFEYKKKVYFAKLFMSSKVSLDRKNADYILSVMEHELRDKVDPLAVFSVIDAKKGIKYDYRGVDKYLDVEVEANSFEKYWENL